MDSAWEVPEDFEIEGQLSVPGDVIVRGRIEGSLNIGGHLWVMESGLVQGEIRAASIQIFGRVVANVHVDGACELKDSAWVEGELNVGELWIEESAQFLGRSQILRPGAVPVEEVTPSSDGEANGIPVAA